MPTKTLKMFRPARYMCWINPADVVYVARAHHTVHKRKVVPWFTNFFRWMAYKPTIRSHYVRGKKTFQLSQNEYKHVHFEKPQLIVQLRGCQKQYYDCRSIMEAERQLQDLKDLMEEARAFDELKDLTEVVNQVKELKRGIANATAENKVNG